MDAERRRWVAAMGLHAVCPMAGMWQQCLLKGCRGDGGHGDPSGHGNPDGLGQLLKGMGIPMGMGISMGMGVPMGIDSS